MCGAITTVTGETLYTLGDLIRHGITVTPKHRECWWTTDDGKEVPLDQAEDDHCFCGVQDLDQILTDSGIRTTDEDYMGDFLLVDLTPTERATR